MAGRDRIELQEQFGRQMKAGEVIFHQGDTSDHAFLLQAGRVELSRSTAGAERVFRIVQPGDIFGTSALLDERVRTATARCTLSGRALGLSARTFVQALESDPEVAARLLRSVLQRMRAAENHVETLLLSDSGARVLSAIAGAASGTSLSTDGTFTLSPAALAADTGLDISVVRQYVQALRGDAYLSIKDERIAVDDVPRLLHLRDGLARDAAR